MNLERIETLIRELLVEIGEDPDRPGLIETPNRVARFWEEFIQYNPGNKGTTFESVSADQLVVVSGMRVFSLCEHHLLPFHADVSIGYITGDRVLGLSKFARIAHHVSHRLQIQERMAEEIAVEVLELTGSPDVAVFIEGVHSCMIMRGIKTPGTMKTSIVKGAFRNDPSLRSEFLSLAR